MWDIARKPISLEMVGNAARTMRYYKMNDLQLHLSDCLLYTSEEVAREHDSFTGAARAMGIEPPLDPIMGMIFLPLPVIPTLRIRPCLLYTSRCV